MVKFQEKWRQLFHLEPPNGWLNDPNGLCFFQGKYHVYFQYSPENVFGNSERGWGHYESADLLNWDFTGFVIRPDIAEDRDGAYSGSAVIQDKKINIFYTGNVKEEGEHDYITSGRGANVIRLISEDGHKMSEKEVLLRNSDYPKFCSCHVRDPKVWFENGKWRMVLGARTLEDKGCVLYYSSNDLKKWKYDTCESVSDFGYMWECPDHFTVDGHKYLSVCPQGLTHEKMRFQNVYQAGYFRADNELSEFEEWDYGFDFYAPQTFETPDGRRILIGWMGIGDIPYQNPTTALGWQHCLTMPREITRAEDGALLQNPIRELERLRVDKIALHSTKSVRMTLPFECIAKTGDSFAIKLSEDVLLRYDRKEVVFQLKFLNEDVGAGRTERFLKLEHCDNVRMLVDRSSIEIYLNNGRKVLGTRFYPKSDNICVNIIGADAEIYLLEKEEEENEKECSSCNWRSFD